jgi:hypothetical protein
MFALNKLMLECLLYINELRSYWFETVSSLLFYLLLMLGIYWMASSDGLSNETNLVAHMTWVVSAGLFTSLVMIVKTDVTNRVLEVMHTFPMSYSKILFIKSVARAPYDFSVMLITLLLIFVAFKPSVTFFDVLGDVVVLYLYVVPFVYSFALVACGLIIAFKRAEVFVVLGNALIGLSAYAYVKSGSPPVAELLDGIYFVSALVSLLGSYLIFYKLRSWTLKKGALGHI